MAIWPRRSAANSSSALNCGRVRSCGSAGGLAASAPRRLARGPGAGGRLEALGVGVEEAHAAAGDRLAGPVEKGLASVRRDNRLAAVFESRDRDDESQGVGDHRRARKRSKIDLVVSDQAGQEWLS